MYTKKTRRKKHTENVEITTEDKDTDEEDEENRQISTSKTKEQQDPSSGTRSLFNLSGKIHFFCLI
jgi:hypothetical protein